jgi:hypothetical protein
MKRLRKTAAVVRFPRRRLDDTKPTKPAAPPHAPIPKIRAPRFQ